MISIVTSFKKFKGVYDSIQRSAIFSWKTLPIYTLGSEIDTLQKCSTFPNIKIMSDIRRGTDLGFNLQVPVFKDLMNQVIHTAPTTMIGIVNSDIILPPDFLHKCIWAFDTYGYDIIVAGTRFDVKLSSVIKDEESHKKLFEGKKSLQDPNYSDIFITSKFIWRKILNKMPDFFFGRPYLNDYLYLQAELLGAKRYNCTNSLMTLHPIHSPDYVKILEDASEKGSTIEHNRNLMERKGMPFNYSIKYWTPL